MRRNHRQQIAIVALVWTCLFATVVAAQTRFVSVGEGALRMRTVVAQVMPAYPAASVARGSQGVVVSLVMGAPDGRIQRVDILQSPDPDIAAAVRDAVMQWTIRTPQPMGDPATYVLRDKLTFYFQIRNGKGAVLYPEQMPGNEDVFAAWAKPAARAGGDGNRAPMVRMIGHDTAGVEEIDEVAFRRLLDDTTTILLDVRDREPFAGVARPSAVNIPFDEVTVRAGAELSRTAHVVIDCWQEDTSKCRFGATMLRERGFEKIAIYLP